jgi:hypothetical protein
LHAESAYDFNALSSGSFGGGGLGGASSTAHRTEVSA